MLHQRTHRAFCNFVEISPLVFDVESPRAWINLDSSLSVTNRASQTSNWLRHADKWDTKIYLLQVTFSKY